LAKILVCDDDEGIVEVMQIILEENGYEVKPLTQGKGIEKKVAEYQPDLIFLDIWMPGIDGQETTKLLKKGVKTKDIPVVLVSALNEIGQIKNKVGADDFLAKPFDIQDLLKMVRKYTS
jgi:two-component system, OmpR family, alkaline phosphatase synthesis response regulator PhoP